MFSCHLSFFHDVVMSFVLYQILQSILRETFIPCSVNEVKFVNNSDKPGPHHGSCFIKIPALIIITGTRVYSTSSAIKKETLT